MQNHAVPVLVHVTKIRLFHTTFFRPNNPSLSVQDSEVTAYLVTLFSLFVIPCGRMIHVKVLANFLHFQTLHALSALILNPVFNPTFHVFSIREYTLK